MKCFMKIAAIVMAVLISASLSSTSFAYSNASPRPSVITVEAVPVGETFTCSFVVYSANGFPQDFVLREDNIEIKGTGKADIVYIETTSNTGLTVSGGFKLKATYPGQITVAIKYKSLCDSAGNYNTSCMPRKVDLKIFNIDGENAYEKMTDFEAYLTYFAAPFWSLFNSIKNLFN